MAELIFNDVTVRYPVYDGRGMSLRNQLVRLATGGTIEREAGCVTVVTALRQVSFRLQSGDAVGVIGHNGAGKSTLLRTMAGIFVPESGTIHRQGKVATLLEIGAGLVPELSGYENIIHLGVMMGLSVQEARAQTPDIETFTELGDFLRLPVRTYSAGMTMRLMFAVATAVTPDILLIDELFSTGDARFQEKSQERMRKLIAASQILVLASHDHDLIKTHCNRIFCLEHGSLVELSYETFV